MKVIYIYDENNNETLVSVDKIVTIKNIKFKDKILISLSNDNYIISNEVYSDIIEKITEAEEL